MATEPAAKERQKRKPAVKSGRVNVTLAEKVTKAFSGQKQAEVVAVAMA